MLTIHAGRMLNYFVSGSIVPFEESPLRFVSFCGLLLGRKMSIRSGLRFYFGHLMVFGCNNCLLASSRFRA